MSYVRIKITGLNLIRIIDKLVSKNVLVQDIVIKKTFIKFLISESDLKVLNKICKNERKFYKILQKNGLKQLFYRVPYCFGILFAFIICTFYFYSTALFINKVNVVYKSNNYYNLSSVYKVLNENDVISGASRKGKSVSNIRKLILLNVDSIEDCTVEYFGRNLLITIFPASLKEQVKTENIVSKYDAVIESANAFLGELKVKAGDIVKKGDILIEKNENGASGVIVGKVYFSATKIYNENVQEIIYTGREYEVNDFLFGDKIISFGKNNCDFTSFLTKKCSFFISKNLFLPLRLEKTKYIEIEIKNKIIPFSEVEEQIKKQAYEEAKKKISSDSEITNVTYSAITENGMTRVDCFIETKIKLF